MSRISSLDLGYTTGDLSVYPEAIDTTETLYQPANNAETTLKNTLSYTGKRIIVKDASGFPSQGLLRVGPPIGSPGTPELIYYGSRTNSIFKDLVRGFSKSRQNFWPMGSTVANAVHAEHHNALKDAILNIQSNLGIIDSERATPDVTGPLNGILKEMEARFISPKPLFRATKLKGPAPLRVRFQNFTGGDTLRFLWDFGDGGTSAEESPIHTYYAEGIYTVGLDVITSTGGTAISTKFNYIEVNNDIADSFFYILPLVGTSTETALSLTGSGTPTSATTFTLVDQTDGDVINRFWVFGDGQTEDSIDPNTHVVTHVYDEPGTYDASVIVLFADQSTKFLQEEITVI